MLTDALNFVLDLVYPPLCIFCGQVVPLDENKGYSKDVNKFVCRNCLKSVSDCRTVTRPKASFVKCFSVTGYEFAREAIHALKYEKKRYIASIFAELCVKNLNLAEMHKFDYVVPVPLNIDRSKERGFNQAALFASHLASLCNIPFLDALVRQRATKPQFGLTIAQRQENVRNAFAIAAPLPPNSVILLADDILTTGATLSECASVLMQNSAAAVYCITFAETEKD